MIESLQQRHEELIKRHQEAIIRGENAKARRMDRIAKVSLFLFTLKMYFYHFLLTAISRSY